MSKEEEHKVTAVKNQTTSWQVRVAAAATSSAAIASLVQPLEVVKTIVQTNKGTQVSTPLRALRHVVKSKGVGSLWKGLQPSLWRCVPGVTLYFLTLSELQRLQYCKEMKKKHPVAVDFVTAGAARALCTVPLLPLTVIKTRFEAMAARETPYRNTYHAMTTIARVEGVRSLFAGLSVSLVRDIPSAGIFFVSYEFGRKVIYSTFKQIPGFVPSPPSPSSSSSSSRSSETTSQPSSSVNNQIKEREKKPDKKVMSILGATLSASQNFIVPLVAGAFSGFMSTLITQAPDVIRARQQLTARMDTLGVCKEIWKESGIRGFFAGTTPRLLRRSMTTAFTWASFEIFIDFFGFFFNKKRINE